MSRSILPSKLWVRWPHSASPYLFSSFSGRGTLRTASGSAAPLPQWAHSMFFTHPYPQTSPSSGSGASHLHWGIFFVLTHIRDRNVRPFVAFFPPVAIALSSVTLETLSSHYSNALPLMVVEGRFTAYAMDINVVGGMFFIGAAANFLRIFLTRRRPDERISLNLCLLFGLAGLLFPASELWSVD